MDQMDPKSSRNVFIGRGHTERGGCDEGGRDWREAATSQEMPETTRGWRNKLGSFPGTFRRSPHLNSGLPASRIERG